MTRGQHCSAESVPGHDTPFRLFQLHGPVGRAGLGFFYIFDFCNFTKNYFFQSYILGLELELGSGVRLVAELWLGLGVG